MGGDERRPCNAMDVGSNFPALPRKTSASLHALFEQSTRRHNHLCGLNPLDKLLLPRSPGECLQERAPRGRSKETCMTLSSITGMSTCISELIKSLRRLVLLSAHTVKCKD